MTWTYGLRRGFEPIQRFAMQRSRATTPTYISTPARLNKHGHCANAPRNCFPLKWAAFTNDRSPAPRLELPVGRGPDCSRGAAWLALNRQGLVCFCTRTTGDDLLDHTDHAIWMGAMRALDLSIFDQSVDMPDAFSRAHRLAARSPNDANRIRDRLTVHLQAFHRRKLAESFRD